MDEIMKNIKFKKIVKLNKQSFKKLCDWMFNWWGKEEHLSYQEIECYMLHTFNKGNLPMSYGLFLENRLIGFFNIIFDDLRSRPDIYPWFANFYIDEQYRGKGLGGYMLKQVSKVMKENNLTELHIYTEHFGLYEKFGWNLVRQIDTYYKTPRIQNLYNYKLPF